jgi:hypothetical protein
VREQLVDRAVLALQIDPRVDHVGERSIAAGDDVGERDLERPRLRHHDGVLRMEQRVRGPRSAVSTIASSGGDRGSNSLIGRVDDHDVGERQLGADLAQVVRVAARRREAGRARDDVPRANSRGGDRARGARAFRRDTARERAPSSRDRRSRRTRHHEIAR